MGAISSISATSLADFARKFTLTFWIGSSNGPGDDPVAEERFERVRSPARVWEPLLLHGGV